ncbi:hypothetical protein L1987_46615 [Smallanthus sonchifolius]|uniref:Uncharacterized protein n=1 Tax=Smallanthus sonchifolius TaxID=185202 RepID=A0ACB9G177_9ASTR|nr:hypothetical protein L1987_46615 [Smallanthus sonchifolius]
MGPDFSSFMHEEGKLDDFAREGSADNLHSDVSVDAKDSDGQTPLHWAVDLDHIDINLKVTQPFRSSNKERCMDK